MLNKIFKENIKDYEARLDGKACYNFTTYGKYIEGTQHDVNIQDKKSCCCDSK